ncbi:hypothetical protein [Streptomyces sp. NBC_00259]|uniref:hypothetical protein n=1 Tax=Streptomyces sp. NBC_00259 TaxID=2903643 RepID=UPI002E28FA76|nr:hypothetical protein [Streptomyces sp. NBC_00259]
MTIAALVLAVPVSAYAYADAPRTTYAEDARADGEGSRADSEGSRGNADGSWGDGRHDGGSRWRDGDGLRTHDFRRQGIGGPMSPRVGGAAGPGQGDEANDGTRPHADLRRAEKPGRAPSGKASASPTSSLAGRQAGEGRDRPGRTVAPSPSTTTSPDRRHDDDQDDADDPGDESTREEEGEGEEEAREEAQEERGDEEAAPTSTAPPSRSPASPAAVGQGRPHTAAPPLERQVPVLTLGAGCALMGLGLGYMGLRLRRG